MINSRRQLDCHMLILFARPNGAKNLFLNHMLWPAGDAENQKRPPVTEHEVGKQRDEANDVGNHGTYIAVDETKKKFEESLNSGQISMVAKKCCSECQKFMYPFRAGSQTTELSAQKISWIQTRQYMCGSTCKQIGGALLPCALRNTIPVAEEGKMRTEKWAQIDVLLEFLIVFGREKSAIHSGRPIR